MPISLVGSIDRVTYRLKIASVVFLCILTIGTLGYKYLVPTAHWFDCLYMTVVTISTIGYAEILDFTNNIPARVFTIFLAFSGIGVLTYLLSNVAAFLIEGELRHNLFMRRMENRIKTLEDHYIICGVGRVGSQIAEELHLTERPFAFADFQEERVERLYNLVPKAAGLVGDCTEDDVLARLGVERAKGLFIATDDDNANLVICVSAKQMKPNLRIVAMCKDPRHTKKLRTVGVSRVVSPSFIGGSRMVSEMIRPNVMSFMEMIREHDNNLRIEEIKLHQRFTDDLLEELPIYTYENTIIMAVKEGTALTAQWHIKPKGNYKIKADSTLLVVTTPEERKMIEASCT